MDPGDIIRAWKDAEYRANMSDAERAGLPAHPAGLIDLSDEELASVQGRAGGNNVTHRAFTCIIKCP
jgi:mersacidin/lichenicidin family type 2 lantibiotic